jgi:hypothetical protein
MDFHEIWYQEIYWLRNSCRLVENLNRRDHLEGVDGKIILKCVLKK